VSVYVVAPGAIVASNENGAPLSERQISFADAPTALLCQVKTTAPGNDASAISGLEGAAKNSVIPAAPVEEKI